MMVALKQVPDQRPVLVVGLGITGWSVVRHLKSRGEEIAVVDSRPEPPYLQALQTTYPDVPFAQWHPDIDFSDYAEVVASPGVAVPGENVIGDIELFVREAKAPIVAVTGSNGKSTVTMLVQAMLNCAGTSALAGGNIGTPALDLLSEPVPDFYVLELSSFQLEIIHSLQPVASVVLNISEDHMDRYDSMAAYRQAKLRIYNGTGWRVINRDEPRFPELASDVDCVTFGLDAPANGNFGLVGDAEDRWFCQGAERLAPVAALTLQGEQNVSNMLAAMALVDGTLRSQGQSLDAERIRAGLAYTGLPHRCELVPTVDGIHWINDSKGTNVGATLAAINGANRPLILIAGGQGKGADFDPLRSAMDSTIKGVVLIGEDADRIATTLQDSVAIYRAQDLNAAVQRAADLAVAGDTVLFSPACASFDMFDSYAHRGDCFRRLVTDQWGG